MFLYQEGRTEANSLKLLSHIEEMDILAVQVENWSKSRMVAWG